MSEPNKYLSEEGEEGEEDEDGDEKEIQHALNSKEGITKFRLCDRLFIRPQPLRYEFFQRFRDDPCMLGYICCETTMVTAFEAHHCCVAVFSARILAVPLAVMERKERVRISPQKEKGHPLVA